MFDVQFLFDNLPQPSFVPLYPHLEANDETAKIFRTSILSIFYFWLHFIRKLLLDTLNFNIIRQAINSNSLHAQTNFSNIFIQSYLKSIYVIFDLITRLFLNSDRTSD